MQFRPAAAVLLAATLALAPVGPAAAETLPLPDLPLPAAPVSPNDPGELIALDVDAAGLALLEARGFTLRERRRLPHLGLDLVRLRVPPGLSAADGVAVLQALLPSARADVDVSYRLKGRPAAPVTLRAPAPTCPARSAAGLATFADVTGRR